MTRWLFVILIAGLISCSAPRPTVLKVVYVKNGYTYASSSYRTYRARLDNDTLKRGDLIEVIHCRDTSNPRVFRRIN